MVKQTKTFKKGNVTKKALSAILAASMVMTSSSFVMAAPADVAVEDVAVETAAPETEDVVVGAEEATEETTEAEAVEETEEAAEEENVGVRYAAIGIKFVNNEKATYEYTGDAIKPEIQVLGYTNATDVDKDGKGTVLNSNDYDVNYTSNKEVGEATVYVATKNNETTEYGPLEATAKFNIVRRKLDQNNTKVTYSTIPDGGFTYNGKKQVPEATVTVDMGKDGVKTLDKNDYTLEFISNDDGTKGDGINVGAQTVQLKFTSKKYENTTAGKGPNYAIGYKQYAIVQAPFDSSNIQVSARTLPVETDNRYSVKQVKSFLTVTNKDGVEVNDYDLEVYDANGNSVDFIKAVGTYKIKVSSDGEGNYKKGSVDSSVTIAITTLEEALKNITIKVDSYDKDGKPTGSTTATKDKDGSYYVEYNGDRQKITDIKMHDLGFGTLEYWDDYMLDSKLTAVDSGYNLTATVIGSGFFEGQSAEITVAIRPKTITGDVFHIESKLGRAQNGKQSDNATITDFRFAPRKGYEYDMVEGKDYTYTTDKKTGKVIVTGKGNFAGTAAFAYEEGNEKFLNDPSIVGTVSGTYKYTGQQITPDVVNNVTLVEKNGEDSFTLRAGIDYAIDIKGVTYGENKNVGIGTITIQGKGEYQGSKTLTFKISGTNFSDTFKLGTMKDISASDAWKAAFTNRKYGQDPEVVYKSNGNPAEEGTYVVNYYVNGVEIKRGSSKFYTPGTEITVVVTGQKQYEGKLTTSYKVLGYNIADFVKAEAIADQDYTGKAIEPFVKVTMLGGTTLKNGRDYTISYKNNVEVGTATAIVTGIGKYSGTVTVPFKIVGQMEQAIDVLDVQERDLGNGTRTLNSKGTKIKYTVAPKTAVTYTSSNPDVVSVDAEGNIKYTGLGEATIKIVAAESDIYKAASVEVKVVVTLKRPTMTLFTRNNAFTFTTSTVNGAKQFEIQYATNKEFENAESKVYSTTGKLRQVKVSAKDKTTYYVRIRAINGSTKTAWSAYKTVATK